MVCLFYEQEDLVFKLDYLWGVTEWGLHVVQLQGILALFLGGLDLVQVFLDVEADGGEFVLGIDVGVRHVPAQVFVDFLDTSDQYIYF